MREIKFRAWSPSKKIMGEVISLMKESAVILFSDHQSQTNNFELMQFTGLLDKNGKEIYEGDIVFNHSVSREENGEVQFSDIHHAYIIEYKSKKGRLDDWEDMHGDEHNLEIIGNIYQNPELISK